MELLKSKITIALIVMIWGVSYIGGLDGTNLEDEHNEPTILANA